MKIPVYKNGAPAGYKEVPDDIMKMAADLSRYMGMNDVRQAYGIGPVADLESQLAHAKHALANTAACLHARNLALDGARAQLAEITRERDTLKAMVDLHDAMNDRRRAQANETPFKRRTYEN